MSKIALSGNLSGTGTFTIASPNSNTDRTVNLPDAGGDMVLTTATQTLTNKSIDSAQLTGNVAAARITDALNASGSAPVYACRAWVNFNGNNSPGTIRASGNVSSVTKNGTGDYTVNFTTAMPDANYAASIKASNDFIGIGFAYDGRGQVNTTTSMRFTPAKDSSGGLTFDSPLVSVIIFR